MSERGKTISHTPGPWYVNEVDQRDDFGNGPVHVCVSTYEDDCADAIAWIGDCQPGEQEANARLIAAAPELLAACKAALTIAASSANRDEVFDQIAAAVRKAVCGEVV